MNKGKILYIYFFLLFVSAIVITIISTTFKVEQIKINKDGVTNFNTGWRLDSKDGSHKDITLPVHDEAGTEKNKVATIQNTLPIGMKNGMTIAFSTYHSTVEIFVDNKFIYQFGLDNQFKFGKSPASTAWHFVDLPDGSQGKQITLKFCSPYTKYAGTFNSITIGTKTANIISVIYSFLPSMIISFVVFIFGIVLLAGYFISKKRLKKNLGLLYNSLFAIGISISAIMEIWVLQLGVNNVLVQGYIMYFALMLCPIPYLLFVKTVYTTHYEKLYDMLCAAVMVNFVVCLFLQVTNIMDLPETVVTTHLIFIAGLLLSAYTSIEDLWKYNNHAVKPFLIGTAIMLVFYLIDVTRYYTGNYKDGTLYSRIGLLIFIAIPATQNIFQHFSMIELGMEARVLKRLAYTDILTNLKNRTAFEMEMDTLNVATSREKVIIVTFDLNNLKRINDNFGHKYGDELIITAANCIRESFSTCGNCFRMGGDEFVVIAKDCSEGQLQLCFEVFSKYIRDSNKIEIASGYAKFELTDIDLFGTYNRADELMYINKRQMKMIDFVQTDIS